jgi:hypothetical protein
MAIRLLRSVEARAGEPPPDRRTEACVALVFRVLTETGSGAAVLHTGETPYLEVPSGEIELATDRLTPAAMESLARYLLPDAALRALRADASVRHEWPILPDLPDSRFTIVAALRHRDLWIEVRHARVSGTSAPAVKPPVPRTEPSRNAAPRTTSRTVDDGLAVPSADELWSR